MTNQRINTDIELVSGGDLSDTLPKQRHSRLARFLRDLIPHRGIISEQTCQINAGEDLQRFQIEDYPKGYPRFSALMASHDSFQVFQRFSNLRTRLLLLSQDRVALLEKKLGDIDRDESSPLFLASSRRDKNAERQCVISDIQDALKAYDDLLERNSRVLGYGAAHPRDVLSLQNWHMGNACISREEMEFLNRREDLLCFSPPSEGLMCWLERYISERLMYLIKRNRSNISRDNHVHIYIRDSTNLLARAISTPLIILLLLVPIVICNSISSLTARLAIMIAATSLFITILSLLTKGKIIELVVAGATYTTVLIVFITGPNSPAN